MANQFYIKENKKTYNLMWEDRVVKRFKMYELAQIYCIKSNRLLVTIPIDTLLGAKGDIL